MPRYGRTSSFTVEAEGRTLRGLIFGSDAVHLAGVAPHVLRIGELKRIWQGRNRAPRFQPVADGEAFAPEPPPSTIHDYKTRPAAAEWLAREWLKRQPPYAGAGS